MITEERIASYICSLEGPEDPVLQSIRENALRDGVPIVVAVTVEGDLAVVIVMAGDIEKASGPLDSLQ